LNYKKLLPEVDLQKLPAHIGLIMDGNGRWAAKRHRPRIDGHRAGARAVRKVVELATEIKLGYLTIYAFSTENWNRPADEVQALLKLLKDYLIKELAELNRENIKVRIIGSQDRLDPSYLKEIHKLAGETTQNTGLNLNIAFNYGGRLEIIESIKKIFQQSINNPKLVENLTPQTFSNYLYTAGQPDPDLIIRTSGEYRLSNFLLWQSAYSEIYITETLWPDFDKVEFLKAIIDFQGRKRRFGGIES
jgi:undecaprenyl diphosphate synthase